jgi:hypothetical protein
LIITPEMPLPDVAFVVCTALSGNGLGAVLVGGSAATVYAPRVYQSRDMDFVIQFVEHEGRRRAAQAVADLGYVELGGTYSHPTNPFTLEFPPGPLAVGDDLISEWKTLERDGQLLHIVTPTDCVRDRLMWFYLQPTDRSSLLAAVGVAQAQEIDVDLVRSWSIREGFSDKFAEFARRIASRSS